MQEDKIDDQRQNSRTHLDEGLFERMVEESRDGICITQNGMFKYVNKAFCDLLGYSSEEIINMPGADMLAPWEKERMMAQHYKRMEGKHQKDLDTTTLIRKDGSYVDIEISTTSIEYQGSLASFISARDITERNHLLLTIEKSEQKYRMLVENAKDGIAITQDGKFKFVNKALCEALEFTEDELVEMDFINVVAEEDRQRLIGYHTLRMSGSRHSMIYDAKAITKSGKLIYLELNTTYIEYNNRPATFIILRNQNERKRLEENLKASERKYRKLFEAESDAIFLIEKKTGKLTPASSRMNLNMFTSAMIPGSMTKNASESSDLYQSSFPGWTSSAYFVSITYVAPPAPIITGNVTCTVDFGNRVYSRRSPPYPPSR